MADLINVSLCVSDIPRDKIFVAENGKKYISICVSELRQPDQVSDLPVADNTDDLPF
jgi:hypothetical protein|nr:MAG TPA: hypothetical protein [Caudoviricetes sp.]